MTVVSGIIYLVIKGGFIYLSLIHYIDADIFLIIICYFIIREKYYSAFLYAWLFGTFIDILSVGPYGLFSMTYVITFLCLRFLFSYFNTEHRFGQMLFVLTGFYIKILLFIFLLNLFDIQLYLLTDRILSTVSSSIITSITFPLLVHLVDLVSDGIMTGKSI